MPQRSVIIAAFNEEATIEECVRRVFAVYPSDCEVLVVDGGSDKTGRIVNDLTGEFGDLRYIYNENDRGKGHAIKTGIAASQTDAMAQIDADIQFLPEELPLLFDPIHNDRADVVLGSRFMRRAVRRPGSTPFFRSLGNKTASGYASALYWHRMTDVQAGMKAW
ncbi:MAG: glycosyltransferase family 2 protein, partial [Pirellulaceae bacterium]|nr:glycosyltransferase family 2 protein [Pirellulaceae bacterium]